MSVNAETIELTLDQKRQIAEAAKRAGRPWQDVLADALRSYRPAPIGAEKESGGREKSFYDVLNEAGLIGIVEDAPPDLSTNPKYMEGFGRD